MAWKTRSVKENTELKTKEKLSDAFIYGTANGDTNDIADALESEGGLCPGCGGRFHGSIRVTTFKIEKMVFYYTLCDKCFRKVQKGKEKDLIRIRRTVEHNLMENAGMYIAIIKHLDEIEDQDNDRMISVLPDSNTEWQKDDKKFFSENPSLKFRSRPIFSGEIESTQKIKPELTGDEIRKGIDTAIVHKVTNEQFIRAYVNDLSDYPHTEESFVAALFIVLLKDIPVEKIMEVYEDIKQRKAMFKDMEDLKTFY